MTDREVIEAIRQSHLKANIDQFEREPQKWGVPMWSEAWIDTGGTIFGSGPYLKVPIKGGEWDGTVQRVYAPARLQRRLAKLWSNSDWRRAVATDSSKAKRAGGPPRAQRRKSP